jgi:SAM-dependent methyltransferase
VDDRTGQSGLESDETDNFSVFLHALRTKELERLPAGAEVVLSGGAAGMWYFDWFESHYPTAIRRHIGVEALAPKPEELPRHVDWIDSSLGDLSAIESGSIDLAFAGEVIEHLWPDDISGFLAETHRVLRPDGVLALDSPNRRVTQAIRWLHPEHTVEFTVDEIVELLELAGFGDIEVRGLVLGYDVDRHHFLPIRDLDSGIGRQARAIRALDRPEDAFVWWAQATRSERQPDPAALSRRTRELFFRFRQNRFSQLPSLAGRVEELPYDGRVIHTKRGESGTLVHGPHVPMPPGAWEAVFELQAPGASMTTDTEPLGWVEVTYGDPPAVLGRRDLTARDFTNATWSRPAIQFEINGTIPGVEFKVFSNGRSDLAARAFVDVHHPPAPPISRRRSQSRTRGWVLSRPLVEKAARKLLSQLPDSWQEKLRSWFY